MAPRIPIALIEPNRQIAKSFQELQHREDTFEVVHVCPATDEEALAELETVLSGDLAEPPASGLGSNANVPVESRRVPRVVVMGVNANPAEESSVREVVNNAPKPPVFVFLGPLPPSPWVATAKIMGTMHKMLDEGQITPEDDPSDMRWATD